MDRRLLHPWAWLGVLALLAPGVCAANVGPPASGGQVVAEPAGIEAIEIRRERLHIDLRPRAENQPAEVTAEYHLENRGGEQRLALLFASGSPEVTAFQALLDDVPVESQPAPDAPLPASWQPPKETPGLHGEGALSYLDFGSRPTVPLALHVTIPPGSHTLRVRYRAEAALHRRGQPTVYHQFAYVLAPARAWAGFGGLDVQIQLPPGWQVSSSPPLERQGDTLAGAFDALPADAIALTTQAPVSANYHLARESSFWLYMLTAGGSLVICWRAGRRAGRRLAEAALHARSRRAWPRALLAGILAGLATFATGLLAVFGPDQLLPADQINHYGYGQLFYLIGVVYLSLLLVPVGFATAQITAKRTWKRTAAHSTLPHENAQHADPAAIVRQ